MTPNPNVTITADIPSGAVVSDPGTYLDSAGRTVAVIPPHSSTSWVGPDSPVHHHGSNDLLIFMAVCIAVILLGLTLWWRHAHQRWNDTSH